MSADSVDQIVAALIDVRAKCETIPKSGFNDFHKYKYATEADISAHIRPLMDAAGLVLIPSVAGEQDGFPAPCIDDHGVTQVVLKYTLAHTSGQVWPTPLYVLAHGDDHNKQSGYSDKGAYKASTGGFKYMLLRLLMVETGDDPENEPKPKSKRREKGRDPEPRRVGASVPAGGGAGMANAEQKKLLTAKCYVHAESLTGQKDQHKQAASIGKCAKKLLGVTTKEFDASLIDGLIAAISTTQLDPEGHAFIEETPEEF